MDLLPHLGPIYPALCVLYHWAGGMVAEMKSSQDVLPCWFGYIDSAVFTQQSISAWKLHNSKLLKRSFNHLKFRIRWNFSRRSSVFYKSKHTHIFWAERSDLSEICYQRICLHQLLSSSRSTWRQSQDAGLDILQLPPFYSKMFCKPGEGICQNICFTRNLCNFMEGYTLDLGHNPEMLRIRYLGQVLLVHLD